MDSLVHSSGTANMLHVHNDTDQRCNLIQCICYYHDGTGRFSGDKRLEDLHAT